jgi:hypothetical protein
MKTNVLGKLMVLVVFTAFFAGFAQAAEDRVQSAMKELDSTVQAWDMKKIVPPTAKLLKVEADLVRKAVVEQRATLSTLVCAKLVADKTGQTVLEVIEGAKNGEWKATFTKAGITEDAAVEQMESVQTEFAFMTLELRDKLTSR